MGPSAPEVPAVAPIAEPTPAEIEAQIRDRQRREAARVSVDSLRIEPGRPATTGLIIPAS